MPPQVIFKLPLGKFLEGFERLPKVLLHHTTEARNAPGVNQVLHARLGWVGVRAVMTIGTVPSLSMPLELCLHNFCSLGWYSRTELSSTFVNLPQPSCPPV